MARYSFDGTCCKEVELEINGDVISSIDFIGGCPGSLLGIKQLVEGEKVSTVIKKMSGLPCRDRGTSCPDQLAKVLSSFNK